MATDLGQFLGGGGGGEKVITSLPQASTSFTENYSAQATATSSSLVDVVNISGTEGYLMAVFMVGVGFQTARCIITIDGTNVLDATRQISNSNSATTPQGEATTIWPMGAYRAFSDSTGGQVINQYMRVGGNLRFESSLRVRVNKITGNAYNGKVMYYLT